jgi:cytochrome c peroxidase
MTMKPTGAGGLVVGLFCIAAMCGCGTGGSTGPASSSAASIPDAAGPGPKISKPFEPAANQPAAPSKPEGAAPAETTAGVPRIPISAIFVLPAAQGPDDRLSPDDLKRLLDDEKNHQPFIPQAPLGLGDITQLIPADNPMTRAKVELGRMLYFDKRLTRDSTVSCATCHDPAVGWAQDRQFAAGMAGQLGGRNSPTVMNRIFGTKVQFWDGRAASLEEQSLGPVQNPVEMGFTLDELIERIKGIDGYRQCFERIFGEVSAANVGRAIATFERTVLVGESPYDYFNTAEPFRKLEKDDLDADPELAQKAKTAFAGADAHPMSESAKRGRALFFGKANCTECHAGANFSDELFHNLGVGADKPEPDSGRVVVSKVEKDTGAFKTPTVRNVALTAPYMHDGSMKTLMEVVEHYDKGGNPNSHLSTKMKKLSLTQQEKEDLVAYMQEGLTGKLPEIRAPKLP